jgi:uncharacterized protein (TIGR04141 family)
VQTEGDFIEHLMGDVPYDIKRYFFIDRAWYLIKDAFIEALNEHCDSYIQSHYTTGLEKTWPDTLATENDYNSQYIGSLNTIVLDKITPEILSDILRWDNDVLYLYHVKAGFGNTLRDLCAQILIAAARIQQDTKAEKAFIRKIYRSLKLKAKIGGEGYFDKVGKQTEQVSEDDFVDLFNKKVIYVLAVLDTAADQRDIKNMKSFQSNIAKFSLQELSKQMRMLDIDFSVTQIKRASSCC